MKILLIGFLVISCNAFAQNSKSTLKQLFADTIYVYKGYITGGTTSNLQIASYRVDSILNVQKVMLDQAAVDTLNFLISQIKPKRHFQTKVGPSYYAKVISDHKIINVAFLDEVGFIDLTNRRQYFFVHTPFEATYKRFVDKIYR